MPPVNSWFFVPLLLAGGGLLLQNENANGRLIPFSPSVGRRLCLNSVVLRRCLCLGSCLSLRPCRMLLPWMVDVFLQPKPCWCRRSVRRALPCQPLAHFRWVFERSARASAGPAALTVPDQPPAPGSSRPTCAEPPCCLSACAPASPWLPGGGCWHRDPRPRRPTAGSFFEEDVCLAAVPVAQLLADGAPPAPSSPAHSAGRPDGGARFEADSDTVPRMP